MQDKALINRYEPWFLVGAATVYVIRRLVAEVAQYNDMIETALSNRVSSAAVWRSLAAYDHTLNNNVPLIVGGLLFLLAWYALRNLAYPALTNRTSDTKAVLYCTLTMLFLLASALVYHYLKRYIDYRENTVGAIIGLKTYSLYSKRTVLADAIGLGIFLLGYLQLAVFFNYVHLKLVQEMPNRYAGLSNALFSMWLAILLLLAFDVRLPQTLWQGSSRDLLLGIGLGVLILFLQNEAHTRIRPAIVAYSISGKLVFSDFRTFLLTGLIGTTILWGPYYGFYYHNYDPILIYACIAWASALFIAFIRWVLTGEKVVLQTQVSAKSAELSSLRAQINPHFLFNALNSLYATALKEKSEKTADGIQKLGDMMRFMLQENNRDRIPLDKEVEYLRNYIELQRMRIDETHPIEIRVNIQEPGRAIYLAPMLLTPFVENAFKHGISLRQPSWIFITLTLDDTRLYFKVHNSRHLKPAEPVRPAPERHDPEEGQSGVGLDNVRKRLDLIYPGRHQLDIQQSEQDYFVSLTLVYW